MVLDHFHNLLLTMVGGSSSQPGPSCGTGFTQASGARSLDSALTGVRSSYDSL